MTPNSRLIQNKQRKRSNSAAPSYHDTSSDSESHSDHQSRRGFISRLLPNSKASSTGSLNKTGNGFGKLFKRIGGTKAHPDMEDVPKVRPIRHPQQHSKIPLAPPPRRRASSHVSSQFLTELPDQYIVKPSPSQQQQQPLAISSSDSIYSTFAGSDSFESDDEFVDADEFSQEDIDLLERKLALSKRLSGGHFGSAGGLVVCIQPDTLKIPQDHELGQSMINWKRVSGNKRWSQITMIDRRQSVATVVNMKSDEEIRKETEDMLTGQIQKEEMFASDVWTSSSYDISLQVQDEEKEDGEEEEEDGEEKAKRTAYELWKGEDESVTSREKMAEWLGQGKPFNARVLEHYMQRFDFSEMRLESAFRKLCSHLYFKAEAQQIDRILEV
ncbi:hypothetical protein G6F56_011139 [Rhizopus delemar]|nr:hypothetical protein G6F56_011139 [Rhizopus delemar]